MSERQPGQVDIARLVGELSLEEKCAMVGGSGPWTVPGCDRLGIPEWRCSDGPVGVRGMAIGTGLVLPGASALAATWDVALVEELGIALGDEAVDRHVDVLLGPTVNLHRSPRAGRHFESFSEDPELSARMAVAYITGLQSRGVAACVKHFVANDQEHERMTIDVQVDERTLREVYLRPFEAAVREADARSIMAAYNFVNGHHACAQPHTLVDILKGEWGFDGIVVSDWGAMKKTIAPAVHGLDLEMPGPGEWWGHGRLLAAVETGEVPLAALDDKVRRVLGLLAWRGRLPGETVTATAVEVERPDHRALVRRAASDAMVLVKNEGVLPLAPGSSIALIGPGAVSTALLGGGSAELIPYRTTNVLESLGARWTGPVSHVEGIDLTRGAPTIPLEWLPDGVDVSFYAGDGFDGELIAQQRLEAAFNVFHGDDYPGDGPISARFSFTMVPDVSGAARLMAAGLGEIQLFVDGELIADNEVNAFSAGLGFKAGSGVTMLEAHRRHEIVVERRPSEGSSMPILLLDVGVAVLDGGTSDDRLAAAAALAAAADVAIVVVGSTSEWESEGHDRASLHLPLGQDELVRRVVAANPRTVVVLNCGAPMLLPWIDDVPSVLLAWYPGQEGGEAIVDVLVGDAEPGGRMPTTWARVERDTPSYLHYPGEAGVVRYGEELFVGHRWYDARGIEPLIPFGHGGSYATFEWGEPVLRGSGTDVVVEVPVTNAGDRAGSDVVQVYVGAVDPVVLRPMRQLAGFAKVAVDPGQTASAVVRLDARAFARWDVATGAWLVDPGRYRIEIAASAADLRSRQEHTVA